MPKIFALPAGTALGSDLFPYFDATTHLTKAMRFNTLQSAIANAGTVRSLISQSSGSANSNVIAAVVAGTANAITVTTLTAPALSAGQSLFFTPNVANTGATTLARDSLTAKNVLLNGAELVGGELQSGVPVFAFFDGTSYHIISPTASLTVGGV